MISNRPWRRLAAPVLLAAALDWSVPALAQDASLVPPVQLPVRSPVDLTARQIPAVQGPGGFTTADAPTRCETAPSLSFWDRCRGRWTLCKDGWHRHFVGEDESYALPLGTLVNAPFQVQIANAEAACMCLHHFDFQDGTSQLNAHGRVQLAKIRELLPRNFAPVTIEATGVPQLDDARRMQVYQQLAGGSFPLPYERVVSGPADNSGLAGPEAEVIDKNLMAHTQIKGNISTTAGMTFGTSGGGSGGH